LWCLPELIRIKGGLLRLECSPAGNRSAETLLMEALKMARRQRALSWELRSGIDLAKLWHGEGKTGDARALLLPIYNRFSEGFETADLRAAKALLEDLSRGENPRSATALSRKANQERDFSPD
jgi:predicted ATPase